MKPNEEISQPSNQEIQIELSRARTLSALDRTLLAWIRTALTLIGFGFTLARFLHDLIASGTLHLVDSKYPRELGVALMTLGIAALLIGAFDYWRSVKRLRGSVHTSYWSASLAVSLILALISIFIMTSVIADLNR